MVESTLESLTRMKDGAIRAVAVVGMLGEGRSSGQRAD